MTVDGRGDRRAQVKEKKALTEIFETIKGKQRRNSSWLRVAPFEGSAADKGGPGAFTVLVGTGMGTLLAGLHTGEGRLGYG